MKSEGSKACTVAIKIPNIVANLGANSFELSYDHYTKISTVIMVTTQAVIHCKHDVLPLKGEELLPKCKSFKLDISKISDNMSSI